MAVAEFPITDAPDAGAGEVEVFPIADRMRRIDVALQRLVERSLLSARDAESVRSLVNGPHENLDQAVCGLALVAEEALAMALADIFTLERIAAPADFLDPELAKRLSTPFMRATRSIPLSVHNGQVLVAIADPTDLTGVFGCAFALQMRAIPVVVTSSELELLFRQVEPAQREPEEEASEIQFDGDAERLRDLASAEPAVRLCNRLIGEAAKARASDIHLEPEERGFRIRFRIDGALIEREALSIKQGLAIISRFKILSNLDIAERRRPQDGRFSFPVAGRPIDLRISATPNVHGESIVLRLLQRDDVTFDLEALGFMNAAAGQLHRLSDRPNGILLITGPTGSGKTTTLYALLQRLAKRDVKILTIEDPVEYQIGGVSQTQVNPAIGLTFASALRSFLRHDPDIVMVGEMRDLETARTAVQAALTGHLVLSTLHTNDAPSAVTRLLDMGVEDYLVASTLIGVVGQRLVRRVCTACGGKTRPRDLDDPLCAACNGAGYFGRIAVAEILETDEALRAAVKAHVTSTDLAKIARAGGFITMAEDGEEKINQGLTTRQEILKAVAS